MMTQQATRAQILAFPQSRLSLGLPEFSVTLWFDRPTCRTTCTIGFGATRATTDIAANGTLEPLCEYERL